MQRRFILLGGCRSSILSGIAVVEAGSAHLIELVGCGSLRKRNHQERRLPPLLEAPHNKCLQPTKPLVTYRAGARPAPNAFAAEADVIRTELTPNRLV